MTYLVSDLITHHHGVDCAPYWRVTCETNSIVLAKKWAGRDSIITEHDHAEAVASHRSRVLPNDFAGRRVAA